MSLDVAPEILEIPHSSAGKDAYNPTQGAAYHDEPSPDSISSIQLVRITGTRGDPNLVKKHSGGLANDIIRWLRLDDTEEHKQLTRTVVERRCSV